MKNLKRALSMTMASALLVGMMSTGAGAVSASDFTDADEIANKDAVSTMVALGIINGKEDGSYFDPAGNVTRAEMAKMLCVAINGGSDPILGVKDEPTFTDIKGTWAESYIEYCVANGIIAGRGNGKFDPTGTVSATEAAKMLLGVLGYDAKTSGLVGSDWAINTNVLANQNGLYKGLSDLQANTLLTRDNAAQMIYNALDANVVELSANGSDYITSQYSYTGTESVVTGTERVWRVDIKDSALPEAVQHLDGSVYNSRQDAVDTLKEANGGSPVSTTKYALTQITQNVYGTNSVTKYADETMGHKYLSLITDGDAVLTKVEQDSKGTYSLYMDGVVSKAQFTKVETDYSELVGQKVEVLFKDSDDVYGVYASTDSSLIVEDVVDHVGSVSGSQVKIDGTNYKVDDSVVTTSFNTGVLRDGLNVSGNPAATVKAYDNDDNGKIDTVVVYPFSVAEVTYVGKTSFNTTSESNIKFEDVNVYEDIAKGDYIIKTPAANTVDGVDTYALAETVKGEIDSTRTSSVRIDGTWYDYDSDNESLTEALELGNTVSAAVVNGYLVYAEVVTAGHEMEDYALIVKTAETIDGYQAKLLFADGTTKTVTTNKDYNSDEGKLVTYEVVKGEYVLTEALTHGEDADDAGFDLILNESNGYSNTTGQGRIDGERIASDAVIFVKDSKGKFSVMSGADFRKYDTNSVTSVSNAYANADKTTGYNSVVLAYAELSGTVNAVTNNYGYITSTVTTTRNEDGERVSMFTFWNGTELVEDAMTDTLTSLKKGDFFTYEENSDGSYTVAKAGGLLRTAIIAYNEKNGDIRFTDASLNKNGNNVDAEITDETVILGINSDETTGVEGVEPTLAVETSTSGVYQANAYYVMGAANEVALLVVDVYADIPAIDSSSDLSGDVSEDAIQDALDRYTHISLDASELSSSVSVDVPAGATLTVSDTHSSNALTVNVAEGAVLKVTDDSITADKLVVNAAAGSKIIVPNGTLIGDILTIEEGTLKITANGTGMKVESSDAELKLTKDFTVGTSDELNLTGTAKIEGVDGVTLTLNGTVTSLSGDNFYDDDSDATADTATQGQNYTWSTFEESGTSTTITGWLKNS